MKPSTSFALAFLLLPLSNASNTSTRNPSQHDTRHARMERRFIGRRGRAHGFEYLRREEAGLEGRQVVGGNEFDGAGLEGVFSSLFFMRNSS